MRRTVVTGAIVWAILALPGLAGADAASDEIVKKAVAAQGGDAALDKMKAMTWKSKGTLEFMGQKIEFEADYAMQLPDKLRFVMTAKIEGKPFTLTVVVNGNDAWENAFDVTRDMDKQKAAEVRHTLYTIKLSMLGELRDKSYTLTSLGEVKDEGRTLAGIRVTKKGQKEVRLYFDTKTWYLAKTETKAFNEFVMKEVDQTIRFEEYYKKDGEVFFKRMVILQDGKPFITEEMLDPKSHEKLDPKLFEKPK